MNHFYNEYYAVLFLLMIIHFLYLFSFQIELFKSLGEVLFVYLKSKQFFLFLQYCTALLPMDIQQAIRWTSFMFLLSLIIIKSTHLSNLMTLHIVTKQTGMLLFFLPFPLFPWILPRGWMLPEFYNKPYIVIWKTSCQKAVNNEAAFVPVPAAVLI